MSYQQALAYLDSLVNYEKSSDFDYKKSVKLERMQSLSRRLNNPHKGIKSILVSGTKGKGSVSSFINSILMEAGYKVGLYTSPHLFSFRERIRINGEPIGEEDVAGLMDEIRPHVDIMEKEEGNKPTFFEICTIMAFLYFKRRNVEFMVLEVGMGGRLDSTNIAEPLVSVITPISYDHTKHLGSALSNIAFEKCGIIRKESIVISSPQHKEAMDVIKGISGEGNSKLYVVGKDIFFEVIRSDLEGQSFRLMARNEEYPHLEIKLLGSFQIENAATAVAAVEALSFRDIFIKSDCIKDGLLNAKWPGRFEIIHKKPFIVVDGAQNASSVLALKKALKNTFSYKRLFLIVGIMRDKDIDGICRELSDIANYTLATKANAGRACSPEIIKEKMSNYKRDMDVVITDSVSEAIRKSREQATEDDLILITGSLYTVGEAMQELAGLPVS